MWKALIKLVRKEIEENAELPRSRGEHSGVPWVRKFGYLRVRIQEILVLAKWSVRTSTPHVSRGEILYFKNPHVSAVNRIATQTLRDNKITTTKPTLSFDLILMSALTCITEKELELEIRNKGDQFCWKNKVKML